MTWFSGCRQLLSRDIVLSCGDILFLYRDDVATEVFLIVTQMTTNKRSGNAVGLALGRVFMLQHSLVKARSFYVPIEYFLCCDIVWSRLGVSMSQ